MPLYNMPNVWIFPAGSIQGSQLASTLVTPGTYSGANITVDQQGRITLAASGLSGTPGAVPLFLTGTTLGDSLLTYAANLFTSTKPLTVLGKITSQITTEQLRLAYDASNYTSFTVNSVGDLTIAPTGFDTTISGRLLVSQGATSTSAGITQSATWTVVGTTYTALGSNITDTASAAGSMLFDFQVNGVSKGKLTKTGAFTVTDDITTAANVKLSTVGGGLYIKEGSNATMGVATLVAGTVTVNTTKATATARIFLTPQTSGGTPGFIGVSARSAGVSFTITGIATDTSTVAWMIVEPA